MDQKAVLELKKRISKEECSFTRIAACYVDSSKSTVTTINQRFLNLPEEELFKYIEIMKKVLDMKVKEKFLTLDIEKQSVQQSLIALTNNRLISDEMLESFYERVIDEYDYVGNYLIILVHDVYDVPKRSYAGDDQEESEETYEYIIGAICPVNMSKAGLGYNFKENTIKSRVRDWIVSDPEVGFIYPAFEDRNAERDKIGYYTKNGKEPYHEVITSVLGCKDQYTSVEYKCEFERSILRACGSEEQTESYLCNINYELSILMEEQGEDEQRITAEDMGNILTNADIPADYIAKIVKDYERLPEECLPSWLFTQKWLNAYKQQEKKNKARELLSRASTELLKHGPSETAEDIEQYLENTR